MEGEGERVVRGGGGRKGVLGNGKMGDGRGMKDNRKKRNIIFLLWDDF